MTEKKIRATLGDSVIVGAEANFGAATPTSGPYIDIAVNEEAEVSIWLNDGWKVEYIQELPTLPGAIVRNLSASDGALYVRHCDYQGGNEYMWSNLYTATEGEIWGDDTVSEGGFEVLFEGVA